MKQDIDHIRIKERLTLDTEQKAGLNQLTILVIDDCKTSTVLIRQQLISLGADTNNITCVHSASEALSTAKSRFYSCLIVDYHLSYNFTGVELINLMSRAKVISDTTAVLMISGDASQETVLTALSGRVRYMLTKPLQTKALKARILAGMKEQTDLANVEQQLCKLNKVSLNELISIKRQYPNSLNVESLLIDTLVEQQMHSDLEAFLPFCSTKDHASKVCAEAFLLLHKGQLQQAAMTLSDFVTRNPLCLRAIDNLTGLYESLNELNTAFTYAYRAFELTPSSSQRMITAVRITSKLGNLSKLYELGHTFAQKVSATDSLWLNAMFSYVDFIMEHFKKLNTPQSRKEMLHNLNTMFLLIHRQLHTQQRVALSAFKQLTQCRLLLTDGEPEKAHKKLLFALSHYYENLYKMPLVMLRHSLPLLEHFGELSIRHSLVLLSRSNTSDHKLLLEEKDHPRDFSQERYPFSIEMKLLSLCNDDALKKNQAEQNTVQYLQKCSLPPNWNMWLNDYISGAFSTTLPPPFDIRATQGEAS
ncbi:response regulator [Vibrio azureus]|uniref:response regulator n=1 Tax=Vibrio azureus TaxID=512649 RepID=UPI0003A198A6|nr:response regulator [Vibrio azureus]